MARKVALGCELLEGRDCPATINITNGTLTVLGTEDADTIALTHTTDTIFVNGSPFSSAGITRIVVSGGAGNDVITDGSGLNAFLYGGLDDDTIYGKGGDDRIYGGVGNDTLFGNGGNDIIWGGGGTDTISGGTGVNTVNEGSPVRTRTNTDIETQIIQLVNVERQNAGMAPLAINNALNVASDLHSKDMAALSPVLGATQAMQHTLFGTARPEVTDRLDIAGYDTWTISYGYGENIAFGYTSAAEVMNGWMNSPGHRANILDPTFTEIGVSVRADAFGTLFFTQNFGHQS